MLRTWTARLTWRRVVAFRHRMQTDLADRFKVCGYEVFGVDGSRLELPRTESNEERFSPASARAVENRDRMRPGRRARSGVLRPSRPPEEGQQPADVGDGDVPRRDRVALGLADGPSDSSEPATTCGK